jgi:hypothetical protein
MSTEEDTAAAAAAAAETEAATATLKATEDAVAVSLYDLRDKFVGCILVAIECTATSLTYENSNLFRALCLITLALFCCRLLFGHV